MCKNSSINDKVKTMIRIRDTLTYDSCMTPEDRAWINNMSIAPTVVEMNRWLLMNCDHEWMDDWVDVGIESIQKITYCVICEINR